jgi:hypothetical protein
MATIGEWEAQGRLLRAHAARSGEPLDEETVEALVGLNLLGFPTVGSCGGHETPELEGPWIYMRLRPPYRLSDERWAAVWNDPGCASREERRFLAGIA